MSTHPRERAGQSTAAGLPGRLLVPGTAIASDRKRSPPLGRVGAHGLYSYDAQAGLGSDTFQSLTAGGGWRAALLGTVATGALWLMAPRPARAGPDACTVVGTTVTCTGDQSGGIGSAVDFNPTTVDTLNVNSLTANMAPAPGTSGIYFSRTVAGGSVTIGSDTSPFSISVTGVNAEGIVASADGAVTIAHTGDIASAQGDAIDAYSDNGAVSVTGSGKINSYYDGIFAVAQGDVTVSHTGDIASAQGDAIYAYSDNGAVSVTGSGKISSYYDGIFAVAHGDVTVSHTGDIASTYGYGIFALSSNGSVTVTSSGKISAYYTGIYAVAQGDITVSHTGDIVSRYGDGIDAISGGDVTITHTGNIDAAAGHGIYARAAGSITIVNAGDIVAHCCGINAAASGDVTITQTGDINAGTYGIYASSSAGRVNIAVNGGTVYGGYAGIYVSGSSSVVNPNVVTIGVGATVTGGSWAIKSTSSYNAVYNHGTVTGNVDIGSTSSTFDNEPGGLFNSGGTVIAGSLINDGTLAPGGIGTVATTNLTGAFTQNAGGRLAVDVNLATGTADRLNVSGNANLAGTVTPHLMSLGATPQTFTVLTSAATTNNGLTAQDSAVADYRLLFPNATDVQLQVAINFAPAGLTPNQQAVGQNLQQSFLAGGGDLSDLLLSLANEDFASFAAALDGLSPEPYLAQTQTLLWSSIDFSNSLFSCPVPGNGAASLLGEASCIWLRPSGHVASHGSDDGFMGFTERAAGLTGGMQNALAPNWYLDMGFGYERSDIDADTSEADGNVFHGGAALKYIRDRWLVAGSVSGALARYDTSRFGLPTGDTATADVDTASLDLRLRFAYAFGSPAFYVKPMVDFDLVGLWRDAIDESGAGALDLHVQSENDWVASAAPAVEFGTEWRHGHLTWRPYVRAGVRFLSQDDFSATASFAGAPAGVPAFTVTSPLDQTLAEVSAGFNVWRAKRLSLEVSYDGRFGAHDSENGGAVKLRAAF